MGLNALVGRKRGDSFRKDKSIGHNYTGDWDSNNARSMLEFLSIFIMTFLLN